MEDIQKSERKLSGKHVLFMFLAFFGVIFVVNGIFLSKAITSFPGEITKKSYMQGLKYNSVLKQKELQQQLGWSAEIGVVSNELVTRVSDGSGNPLTDVVITAELNQHSDEHKIETFELSETSTGEFSYSLSDFEKGRWTANIKVLSTSGETLLAQKEIQIQ